MSATPKLRGGSNSELTKFKALWRDSLSEDAKEFWRAQFISTATQSDVRKLIHTKLKVKLSHDKQLTYFRDWLDEQDKRDLEAQRQVEDEQRLTVLFGDKLSKDQIRDQVLKASYHRSLAAGDFKLGLLTVREDRGLLQAQTDQKRFMRDTCEMFLKWSADAKAKEIASSNLSNADKIEKLGQAMFGDDWKQ